MAAIKKAAGRRPFWFFKRWSVAIKWDYIPKPNRGHRPLLQEGVDAARPRAWIPLDQGGRCRQIVEWFPSHYGLMPSGPGSDYRQTA